MTCCIRVQRPVVLGLALAPAALLGGGASLGLAGPAPKALPGPSVAAGSTAGPGASPPARPDSAAPRPFDEVVKGASMSDGQAARVLDNLAKLDASARTPAQSVSLGELYARLSKDIWAALASGRAIVAERRELQREHLNKLAGLLLRPTPQARADARGLLRQQARSLPAQRERAQQRPRGWEADTRAHLADSAVGLRQALEAKLPRANV